MFSFTRSRSQLRVENSQSRSRPKTGRLRNIVYRYDYILGGRSVSNDDVELDKDKPPAGERFLLFK